MSDKLFSRIGLSHKKKVSQAVSLPDLPNEDLCEDEIFQYFLLTELGMEIKDNFTCFPRSDS